MNSQTSIQFRSRWTSSTENVKTNIFRCELRTQIASSRIGLEVLRSELDEAITKNTQRPTEITDDRVSDLRDAIKAQQRRLNELASKPHRRWAHGMSCLAFAMFGIPWATQCRHGDIFQSFLTGFLPILLFYYPIEMLLASNSSLPPYTIWIADGSLLLAGIWLLLRLRKY